MGASGATKAAVQVVGLCKRFGAVRAVDGVSLMVGAGELVSLLGPSGCGKTTTLRAIAGLEQPDEGDVYIGGARVTHLPPNARQIGLVFQGYALFPHMTVFDNVAFGLRMRRQPRATIEAAVTSALALVHLEGFEGRLPKQLSGGQQQRVALARALAVEPRVLLLDEPLSNLDAKLRQEMRVELKRILRDTRIATVFVTHDQEEALVLSDRVVLMNRGLVEQQGTPWEIYERPRTNFAAAFIGQANFFPGVTLEVGADGFVVAESEGLKLRGLACADLRAGERVAMVVRQERVRVLAGDEAQACENQVPAQLELVNYLGASLQMVFSAGERSVTAVVGAGTELPLARERGTRARLGWRSADMLVFPAGAAETPRPADEERP
jgi:ABC-type Fe3+/spermidine/putrescine transport system ATPase subunit